MGIGPTDFEEIRALFLRQAAGETGERAYRHAMSALGVEPHETWIVGDHLEWEVAAPQRLGLTAVWCDGFRRGLPPQTAVTPDHIVASLTEIVASCDGADGYGETVPSSALWRRA